MFIQFLYIQKKDTNDIYLYVIKSDNEIKDIYNKIYISLYETETNNTTNINYFSKIYIKKGFKINYNIKIWNLLLSFKLKSLNLLSLIDIENIKKYQTSDMLDFDYEINKININPIIIDIIMNNEIIQ